MVTRWYHWLHRNIAILHLSRLLGCVHLSIILFKIQMHGKTSDVDKIDFIAIFREKYYGIDARDAVNDRCFGAPSDGF